MKIWPNEICDTLIARYKLQVHGMDVIAAYLNGKLDKEVYMK